MKVTAVSVGHLERVIEALGRYGTPTTAVILSSPVKPRAVKPPSRTSGRARPTLQSLPPARARAKGR
jgi:hypothetical protein